MEVLVHKHLIIRAEAKNPPMDETVLTEWFKKFIEEIGMKVKWEDDDGREFSIKVFSREFSWGMAPGDDIKYDLYGKKVTKVGDVIIKYDLYGKKVTKVGNLSISYDLYGKKVTGTRGQVR